MAYLAALGFHDSYLVYYAIQVRVRAIGLLSYVLPRSSLTQHELVILSTLQGHDPNSHVLRPNLNPMH